MGDALMVFGTGRLDEIEEAFTGEGACDSTDEQGVNGGRGAGRCGVVVTDEAPGEVDVISVIEEFLGDIDDDAKADIRDQLASKAGIGGDVSEEIGDFDARIAMLSDIALHYYLSRYRSWIEAYFTAIDKVPAICLSVPGSPVEYADEEDAELVAESLGYASYADMAAECRDEMSSHPFLREYAEKTLDFAGKYWFADMSTTSAGDYAEAVAGELRANWPGAKAAAEEYFDVVFAPCSPMSGGVVDTPEGKRVIIGIQEVDEMLVPESLSACSMDDWDDMLESFSRYNDAKMASVDTEDEEDRGGLDDEVFSLAFLQAYQWSGRSWNKAEDVLRRFLDDCFTFSWACISPEFKLVDGEAVAKEQEELDALAEEMINDEGQVELRQVAPGPAGDVSTYDAKSRRFVELSQHLAEVNRIKTVGECVERVIGVAAGPVRSVADAVVDEALTCVYASSDLTDPVNQVRNLERIHKKAIEAVDKKAKSEKSKWKKWLSAHPDEAIMLKEGARIVGLDEEGEPKIQA